MIKPYVRYIIQFLLGEGISPAASSSIGYTNDEKDFHLYKLVIIPSSFFHPSVYGTHRSLPHLPLPEIEGIPFLFGSHLIETKGQTKIVHADIIASTYFLITRYEEMIKRETRDEYGRFPGKESILHRNGCLSRPIVDEYRILLRKWLTQMEMTVPPITPQIRKIYLTHDLDAPTLYRTWKGVIRSILNKRGIIHSIHEKFGSIENDPYYTFPWLFEQDKHLQQHIGEQKCQPILFIRSGGKCIQDKPRYNLQSNDIRTLTETTLSQKITIGLHSSYEAGISPRLIQKEKKKLEKYIGTAVLSNRHHYLNSREPEDMHYLEAAGITDDFTMGYADVSGFRLGTCYPVRWINPVNRQLSSLTLHPLTIMDCSLNEKKYMNLNYDDAFQHCINLIQRIKNVGGEFTLLWHNTSVQISNNSYLRKLYINLLNELIHYNESSYNRRSQTSICESCDR